MHGGAPHTNGFRWRRWARRGGRRIPPKAGSGPTGVWWGTIVVMTTTASATTTSRPGLVRAYVIATAILTLLVLVQAVLAGRGIAGLGDFLTHGYVGNASFVVGFAAALLAVVSRMPQRQVILAGIVLLLLFTQTGLGYVGRDSAEAAAWHVPLGIVTFSLVVLQHVGAISVSKGGRGSSS
jgi:hypothetical protein